MEEAVITSIDSWYSGEGDSMHHVLTAPKLLDTSSMRGVRYLAKAAVPDRGSASESQQSATSFHRLSWVLVPRATTVETGPDWLADVHGELYGLQQLPGDWDGHGGAALSDLAYRAVSTRLRQPDAVFTVATPAR